MKMEAPKMDVVRFKAADVIAASGGGEQLDIPTSDVYGFVNEVTGDAYISYNGVTYRDSSSLDAALAADGLAGQYQLYQPGVDLYSVHSIQDMFALDKTNGMSFYVSDGTYEWNGSCFVHKS